MRIAGLQAKHSESEIRQPESAMSNADKRVDESAAVGERPRIVAAGSVCYIEETSCRNERRLTHRQNRFRPGDEVFYDEPGSRSLLGPYLIASVPDTGKYKLCLENGDQVLNGSTVDEKHLVRA